MRKIVTVLVLFVVSITSYVVVMVGFYIYVNSKKADINREYLAKGHEVMSFFDHNKEPPSCENGLLIFDKGSKAYGYYEIAESYGDVGTYKKDAEEKMQFGRDIVKQCKQAALDEKILKRIEKNFTIPLSRWDLNVSKATNTVREIK